MNSRSLFKAALLSLGMMAASAANATPFTIKMVADNDFAIFSGTASNINNLLYQNHVRWDQQINALSSMTFNLAAGDNFFYVLAMGGGGQENISGLVNGVNMTGTTAFESNNIRSFLTGYNLTTVENGTYSATLADVQRAMASNLVWTNPVINSSDIVIQSSGFGTGFHFADSTAHLYKFTTNAVNVPTTAAVAEPATIAMLGLGFFGLAAARRRKAK